jgi:cytochrome P450
LYNEICDVIGDKDADITESKLNKMRYLKALLHESQRIFPATIGTSRIAQTDCVILGYQIPKGTMLIYYNQVASNDSENFQNPEMFLPERWLRCSPISKYAHPFSSIPFGHGPRSCIGRRFAHVELYCLIIKVLQKYRIEYHGEPVDTITEFISIPNREVVIKFINRQ